MHTKIQYLKGVGPKTATKFQKLGLETVEDLIFYFPRDYKDFTKITQIGDLAYQVSLREPEGSSEPRMAGIRYQANNHITISGKILGITNKRTSRRGFTVTEAVVEDGTGSIKVVWFNQPFLLKMLPAGKKVILNGKVSYNFFNKELVMESPERALYPSIIPVYSTTAGLTSRYIQKVISNIQYKMVAIPEYLPEKVLKTHSLNSIQEALLNIHFPANSEKLAEAQRRLAFDELFFISLESNLSKEELKKEKAFPLKIDDKTIASFVKQLPFRLTEDQKKASWQIIKDLSRDQPMNRLLNGDVGSGKTVVAAIAAYVAIKSGFKAVVMAPTEILAKQHFETFCRLFEKEKVNIGLITASSKQFKSQNSKVKIVSNNSKSKSKEHNSYFIIHNSDLIVGTHALVQKGVEIPNLGLVVIDEQHRFGVEQRAALQVSSIKYQVSSKKDQNASVSAGASPDGKIKMQNCGSHSVAGLLDSDSSDPSTFHLLPSTDELRPHFLSMTATPIPRTLHLALFGDLDVSIIREKPANRKEIKTRFVEPQNREKAYEFIRKQIEAGRQVFVICPLIEEVEREAENLFEEDRKSVKKEYEKLQKIFPEFKIGMLHGKMKAKEKDTIMQEFSNGKINILVSTSVVEVGVDIPNASVMVIEDAERFGLAQIHQFRGRVGRAEHQSFCFLFSPTQSPKAIERLRSLEATSDGFRLAEIDLETRGPGAVFGTEQSGLLDLKMASFSDQKLIVEASTAAKEIVAKDPTLENHPALKEKINDFINKKHME